MTTNAIPANVPRRMRSMTNGLASTSSVEVTVAKVWVASSAATIASWIRVRESVPLRMKSRKPCGEAKIAAISQTEDVQMSPRTWITLPPSRRNRPSSSIEEAADRHIRWGDRAGSPQGT